LGTNSGIRVCGGALLIVMLAATLAAAQQWKPLGPDGGDVRSFAYDPKNPDRIFLGTSTGTLYVSTDGGKLWRRHAHLGGSNDMVLDNIVIDPGNSMIMYVAAWSVDSPASGELFRSRDGGRNWEISPDLHGKSLRALAMAPSDPQILVAGALDGVFRTRDGGNRWERISPDHHAEIKNIESIAIDPGNPEIIYAGTWHLPWKTEDGGRNWHSIRRGVVDDSDVFSVIIDPVNPSVVYASACSGIYKSESAGELFQKIQGIPSSARRTRVLQMDPAHHEIVYAGTTEGLWKTVDAGVTWKRMTAGNVIVNDVLVDPRNSARVLLATDRGGVLASDDAANNFAASNHGFVHRQVASVLMDLNDNSVLYAGVLNDKEFGGVFASRDAGQSWNQTSEGLGGRDVFVLRQAEDGSIIAGTNRGIFQLASGARQWQPLNVLEIERRAPKAQRAPNGSPELWVPTQFSGRVNALQLGTARWYAATSEGLLTSTDQGRTWRMGFTEQRKDLITVTATDKTVVAVGRHDLLVSINDGESWLAPPLADFIGTVSTAAVDNNGIIWIATREGAFRSTDAGYSWQYVAGLPLSNITTLEYDAENRRMLAAGAVSTSIFESSDSGRNWRRSDSGWLLHDLRAIHGRLVAATTFDGVVIQPESAATLTEVPHGTSGNQ
jgi:photosystem II stability/assembly factor-like uncharacterized protein